MKCKHCGSDNIRPHATETRKSGVVVKRYKCKDCKATSSYKYTDDVVQPKPAKSHAKRFVITSCQNDTPVFTEFLDSLHKYCEHNDAELMVIKTTHLSPHNIVEDPVWYVPDSYLVDWNMIISKKVLVASQFKSSISAVNPLTAVESISKGKHIIIGHPQLQMRTLPTDDVSQPIFAHSTGSISTPNYTNTKAGMKAELNHSYSAIFVVVEGDYVNFRVLCADDTGGFYDLDKYYSADDVTPADRVSALVTGDEHAIFMSPDVLELTYGKKDSIVSELKPEVIVRHDVLDFYSASHHHTTNPILQYKKHVDTKNDVKKELVKTAEHIIDTTPNNSVSIIVSSNHCDHLGKWLNGTDPKTDMVNAKLYHWLMYNVLDEIDMTGEIPDPFKLWFRENYDCSNVVFTSRKDKVMIHGIVLSDHGDNGINGSRGSPMQFAKLAEDHIIGHSHSPRIEKGCYQVGTSTGMLEYARGKTTWANTHCLVYPNGTRQLIHIINGRWK